MCALGDDVTDSAGQELKGRINKLTSATTSRHYDRPIKLSHLAKPTSTKLSAVRPSSTVAQQVLSFVVAVAVLARSASSKSST